MKNIGTISDNMTFTKSLYTIISFSLFTTMVSEICGDYGGELELVSCPVFSLTIISLPRIKFTNRTIFAP